MGVKGLTKYIQSNCASGVQKTRISELRGKKIVVDASIYMYKYKYEISNYVNFDDNVDAILLDNIRQLVLLFQKHGVELCFVFDGTPPAEKLELLAQRRAQKQSAEAEYARLMTMCENKENGKSFDLCNKQLIELRRKSAYITKDNISETKCVLDDLGIEHICAVGEADDLCVEMVRAGTAWGCASDDGDMFVYGCERVVQNIDFDAETLVSYNTPKILKTMGLSQAEFTAACICIGTDLSKNCVNQHNGIKKRAQFGAADAYGNRSRSQPRLKSRPIPKDVYAAMAMFGTFRDRGRSNKSPHQIFEQVNTWIGYDAYDVNQCVYVSRLYLNPCLNEQFANNDSSPLQQPNLSLPPHPKLISLNNTSIKLPPLETLETSSSVFTNSDRAKSSSSSDNFPGTWANVASSLTAK